MLKSLLWWHTYETHFLSNLFVWSLYRCRWMTHNKCVFKLHKCSKFLLFLYVCTFPKAKLLSKLSWLILLYLTINYSLCIKKIFRANTQFIEIDDWLIFLVFRWYLCCHYIPNVQCFESQYKIIYWMSGGLKKSKMIIFYCFFHSGFP